MAWQNAELTDISTGSTENDYYFTASRTGSRDRSAGAYSDITFVLSFTPKDYLNSDAGDYYLIGDSQAGIFIRKTGSAGATNGRVSLKASYLGEADSGSSKPEVMGECSVRSGYSAKWQIFSIICGIDEENHRGTIFGYQSWNDYPPRESGAYNLYYCAYGRYTNSEVAYNLIKGIMPVLGITSNGGGATHIAKRTGQLKDLSSYTSDILIVSGGGGGGLLVGETAYTGKEAGGISGSGDNSADQSTGNAFGQGENGTDVSGGGSGLYGGYKGTSSKSGGAGSGYIGNSLLSNKKMVGYNVPTSSAEGTKTESVSTFDNNYVVNKPKAGNGHARVKLLKERIEKTIFTNGLFDTNVMMDNFDISEYKQNKSSGSAPSPSFNTLSQYFLTQYGLLVGQHKAEPFYIEDVYIRKAGNQSVGESSTNFCMPIKRIDNPISLQCTMKMIKTIGGDWNKALFGVGAIINGEMNIVRLEYKSNTQWVDYELDISSLPYVDYIFIAAYDGSPAYKDFVIVYEK